MPKVDKADIEYLDTHILERRATRLENESRQELVKVGEARMRVGQSTAGPESWEQIAETHQRMADNRAADARIYREVISQRATMRG